MNPAGLFNRTVTITAYDLSESAMGATSKAAGSTQTSVRCAIQPRSSSEGREYERITGKRQAVGYFPSTVTLDQNSRITDGSVVWRVQGPARDVGGRGVYFEVDLEQEAA